MHLLTKGKAVQGDAFASLVIIRYITNHIRFNIKCGLLIELLTMCHEVLLYDVSETRAWYGIIPKFISCVVQKPFIIQICHSSAYLLMFSRLCLWKEFSIRDELWILSAASGVAVFIEHGVDNNLQVLLTSCKY